MFTSSMSFLFCSVSVTIFHFRVCESWFTQISLTYWVLCSAALLFLILPWVISGYLSLSRCRLNGLEFIALSRIFLSLVVEDV